MSRLKVGVVGVGHLGKEHARVYAGLEDAELVGVVDSDADAARSVARKFKTEWSATPDFLLDRAQAVSVVVPTSMAICPTARMARTGTRIRVRRLTRRPMGSPPRQQLNFTLTSHEIKKNRTAVRTLTPGGATYKIGVRF